MARFCPECGSQLRDGVKFCDKCGAQIQAPAANKSAGSFDATSYVMYKANEKSMAVALLISFFITGLGIVYAGNTEKGLIFFAVSLLVNFICLLLTIPVIFFIVALILWVVGLVLTYNEVNDVNNANKLRFLYANK